ncbi:MAG: hypothetical protein M3160_10255 [Candidatus Eremiobacteraeota bacterium]|nr:hypothetical protein [Candidatus Eremiobacteraeota bacterium]
MVRRMAITALCAASVWSATGAVLAQSPPIITPSPLPAAIPATPSAFPTPAAANPEPPTSSPLPTSPTASPAVLPLRATPAQIKIPSGQSLSITVTGGSGEINASLDNRVAQIAVNQAARTVTVTAIMTRATATLHIFDQLGQAVDVAIRVAPNAGTVPQSLTIRLTGDSLDPQFIASQVTLRLLRETQAQPGVLPAITVQPLGQPLLPGAIANLLVPVQLRGGDQYLDVSGATSVTLQNVGAAPFYPTLLHYSDDPERIVSDGVLYRATLTAQQPIRLYDYHENGPQSRRLVLVLSSVAPSSVHMIESFAGPNIDVMTVGHVVTRNFLIYKPRNIGTIVDLAGNAPIAYRDVPMAPRDGVASNLDLRLVSGGPVTVTVLAVSPGINPATLLDGPRLTGDTHNRHGVFSLTGYGAQALQYEVGGADVSADIGDREPTVPNVDFSDSGHDYGDYGVLHQFRITMTNPTDQPASVYVFMAPRAGPVRSSYLIDDDAAPLELGCVRAQNPMVRYLLRSYTLPPRESLQSRVLTMSEGGSNYPITIGASATEPQPTAPPISAPNGCFPKPGQETPAAATPLPSATP